jgi:hypothetical protein
MAPKNQMDNLILTSLPTEQLEELIKRAIREELSNLKVSTNCEPTKFLSRKEAAKFLGVSLPTLGFWSKKGLVISYRISSRVLYKLADLEASLTQVNAIRQRGGVSK